MNWYKKAQGYMASDFRINYPYSLLETIRMQGENGLATSVMSFEELKEAKILEQEGDIKKVVKRDNSGKYNTYVIDEENRVDVNETGIEPWDSDELV